MSRLLTTLRGYFTYRGREGYLGFILHRVTGLGTLLFLSIHILDTALVYFAPALYEVIIALYRSVIFGIGEVFLFFASCITVRTGFALLFSIYWSPDIGIFPLNGILCVIH